jgi:signal transduction histidine kinase
MIVDDEIIIARELEVRLTTLGYEVIGLAVSGDEAITLACKTCPDLVLMDINLKGDMDGIESATEICSRFSVPIIYLTAFADEKTLERARKTEPYGYIVKPFNERELQANIEMALYKHESEIRMQLQNALDAAEYEQRRIGQDLHDSIQQDLAGLSMLAQTLLDNLDKPAVALEAVGARQPRELAVKLVDGITRANHELRVISRGLVPMQLDTDGLMDALGELAFRTDDLDGITCAFKCEQPVSVSGHVIATHLYRIAQESVTNALKHAKPAHILLALDEDNGRLVLTIADDGIGFGNNGTANDGQGVKIMRYRASLIGAEVTIAPVATGGTLITCRLTKESQ